MGKVGYQEVGEIGKDNRDALKSDEEDHGGQRNKGDERARPYGDGRQPILHPERPVEAPADDPIDDVEPHQGAEGEPEWTGDTSDREGQPDQRHGGNSRAPHFDDLAPLNTTNALRPLSSRRGRIRASQLQVQHGYDP